jgi:hypothetical protein
VDVETRSGFSHEPTRVKMTGVMMYPQDQKLVADLAQHFGCSKSEIVRTAVRSFAAHIGYLESQNGGSDLPEDTLSG